MAKIMCMDNEYEIRKDIGIHILENFFEDEYYNCVDAGEKEVCYSDLCIDDAITFLKELKKQFNEEIDRCIEEKNKHKDELKKIIVRLFSR